MFWERVFHPIAIGLFSVLFFHFIMADFLEPTRLIFHLVLVVFMAIVLTILLGRLLGDKTKAALIITAGVVLFIVYTSAVSLIPDFYLELEESNIAPNLLLLPVWLYLFYLIIALLIRTRRNLKPITKILGWAGLVLLIGQLAYGGYVLYGDDYKSSCLDLPGDADNSGQINVGDVVFLIKYVFKNGPPPECLEEANCNGDKAINIGDVVFIINHVFRGGQPPRPSPPLLKDQAQLRDKHYRRSMNI